MGATEYAMHQDSERDNVLNNQFDTKKFLDNIGNLLKGFAYDADTKKYVSIQDNGFVNAVGAKQVLNEIEGRIQNINASANLSKKEIYQILEDVWFALNKKLLVNHEAYNLKTENVPAILNLVSHNLLAFLSRAQESGFFNKLSNFWKRQETISQSYVMPEEKKRRFSF